MARVIGGLGRKNATGEIIRRVEDGEVGAEFQAGIEIGGVVPAREGDADARSQDVEREGLGGFGEGADVGDEGKEVGEAVSGRIGMGADDGGIGFAESLRSLSVRPLIEFRLQAPDRQKPRR